MAIPSERLHRDQLAYKENSTEIGAVDRRVNDSDANAKLTGVGGLLHGITYDAVGVTYPTATTEIYSFYTGGLVGALVATITLVYSNSTKADLVSAVKV
jgi:hypothetical protein